MLDFEDGYGYRPDAEEDGHAESSAIEVARGMAAGQLPAHIGIRIKPLNAELSHSEAFDAGYFPRHVGGKDVRQVAARGLW